MQTNDSDTQIACISDYTQLLLLLLLLAQNRWKDG